MPNNIHISYDLKDPGKNYGAIIDAIKEISGEWAKIHYSFWYVKTTLTAEEVWKILYQALDTDDSLYVVDAKNNSAQWHNLPKDASDYIRNNWSY